MQELAPFYCHTVQGGKEEIATTTVSDNSNWKCECYCYDTAQRRFVDESDDSWAWWFITRPYYTVMGIIGSFL